MKDLSKNTKIILTIAFLCIFAAMGALIAYILGRPAEPGDRYMITGIAFVVLITAMALKDVWPKTEYNDDDIR